MQRLLVLGNLVIGISATLFLFNAALPEALLPHNSNAATAWAFVAGAAFVIAMCFGNMAYIHQTVARPFARWSRFLGAWNASKDSE